MRTKAVLAPEGSWLTRLGREGLQWLEECRGMLALLWAAVCRLPSLERRELFLQVYAVGNRSLFFVMMIMGFTGAIMMVQTASQAQRVVGDLSIIGPAFLKLLMREFGPTIGCLMIATRYGASVAAQIGAMKTTEQLDALRMAGADPVSYLVVPRLVACVLASVPLGVFGVGMAFVTGGVAVVNRFGVASESYFRLTLVTGGDVVVGVVKTLVFGVAIAVVACWAGLEAEGGAPGVGKATTAAVIKGSIAVLALDFVIGLIAYGMGL